MLAAKPGQECCSTCTAFRLRWGTWSSLDLDELAILSFVYIWVCLLFLCGSHQEMWSNPATSAPDSDYISLWFSLRFGFECSGSVGDPTKKSCLGDPKTWLSHVPIGSGSGSTCPLQQPVHILVNAVLGQSCMNPSSHVYPNVLQPRPAHPQSQLSHITA